MKSLNTSIIEKLVINKNIKSDNGYYNTDDLKIKYVIVYPNGYVEFFRDENTINNIIKEIQKEIDNISDDGDYDIDEMEESIGTYEELLDINEIRLWKDLSGPINDKSKIRSTYGIKLKK